MRQTNIVPGSVVRLRSGGPRMTVNSVAGFGATCVWMVNNFIQSAELALACLAVVKKA